MTWRSLAVGSLVLIGIVAKLTKRSPVPALTLWQEKQIAWGGKLNHPDLRAKKKILAR